MIELKEIFEAVKLNLKFDDVPILMKGAITNYTDLCSWKDLEYVTNTPEISSVELIDDGGTKIPLHLTNREVWSSKPHFDHEYVIRMINSNKSLIVHRWEDFNLNVRNICKVLDETFFISSSAHVYCGLGNTSRSFNIHWDKPSNFIFQIEGETQWKVYSNRITSLERELLDHFTDENLNCVIDDTLYPGDILYIPSRMLHVAKPDQRRISISFPCTIRLDNEFIVNRNYYNINCGESGEKNVS